jgi:chemotaxis protein CheY-P-specific phosphatase CheC
MRMTQIIEETINHIFENMYFMFPEQIPNPESHFSLPKHCYSGHTHFIKDQGALMLVAESNLVTQMAKNFLGEKRSFDHIELVDIFREATNVIAGNYITSTNKPPEVSFEIPVVQTTTINSWDKDRSYQIDMIYDIESNFFRIALAG